MDKDFIMDKKQFTTPAVVTFYMTSKCNLNCQYCYEKGKKSVADISCERIESSIDYLSKTGIKFEAVFLFGGEPTLCDDKCIYLIDTLNRYSCFDRVRRVLFTNGLLISDPLMDKILSEELEVFLSFDGFGESSRMRFGSNLDKYLSIIDNDLNRVRCVSKNITISFAVGKHNINTIESDIKRLHDIYGISQFKINIIRNNRFAAIPSEMDQIRQRVMSWAQEKNCLLLWDSVETFGSKFDNIYISESNCSVQYAGELGTWNTVTW